LFDLIFNNY